MRRAAEDQTIRSDLQIDHARGACGRCRVGKRASRSSMQAQSRAFARVAPRAPARCPQAKSPHGSSTRCEQAIGPPSLVCRRMGKRTCKDLRCKRDPRVCTRGRSRAPDAYAWAKSARFRRISPMGQAICPPTPPDGCQLGQRDIKRSSPCLMAAGREDDRLPPTSWNTGGCAVDLASAPNLTWP